jgi:hypothetical protein
LNIESGETDVKRVRGTLKKIEKRMGAKEGFSFSGRACEASLAYLEQTLQTLKGFGANIANSSTKRG